MGLEEKLASVIVNHKPYVTVHFNDEHVETTLLEEYKIKDFTVESRSTVIVFSVDGIRYQYREIISFERTGGFVFPAYSKTRGFYKKDPDDPERDILTTEIDHIEISFI